jgi:hypothetical protein
MSIAKVSILFQSPKPGVSWTERKNFTDGLNASLTPLFSQIDIHPELY